MADDSLIDSIDEVLSKVKKGALDGISSLKNSFNKLLNDIKKDASDGDISSKNRIKIKQVASKVLDATEKKLEKVNNIDIVMNGQDRIRVYQSESGKQSDETRRIIESGTPENRRLSAMLGESKALVNAARNVNSMSTEEIAEFLDDLTVLEDKLNEIGYKFKK